MDVAGGRRAGQFAGSLGGKYDPLLTGGNPNDDEFRLDHLPLAPNEDAGVLRRRMSLIEQLDKQTTAVERAGDQPVDPREPGPGAGRDLVGGGAQGGGPGRRSSRRSGHRYGRNLFGQSVLLGRRLLDAGARLVQCNWQRTQGKNGFAWDTHWNNFSAHKEDLVPPFDQAFDALHDRPGAGRAGSTRRWWWSPRSSAGRRRSRAATAAANTGRTATRCCSPAAASRAARSTGSPTRTPPIPPSSPTTPADFTATIYHCLGIDPHTETHDQGDRPIVLSKGAHDFDSCGISKLEKCQSGACR